MSEKRMLHPLAITMWDFSWIERNWSGAGFEDIDKVLDELVERGYNAVRIDAFPHLIAKDMRKEWTLKPVWYSNDWGSPYINRVTLYPAFPNFLRKCRERGIKVGLSSWYREDVDDVRMEITSSEKMADNWITVLDPIKSEGLMDTVLYVDMCNEWPGNIWAPYFQNEEGSTWGWWYTETSMKYMKRAIECVREKYNDIPLCFSLDNHDPKHYLEHDLSFFDLTEQHLWMTGLNNNEFYALIGKEPDGRWSDKAYHILSDNCLRVYNERPEYWKQLLKDGIRQFAENVGKQGLMLATTECWGIVDYKDNFQHALPLVHFVLRYMLKRTTPFGEIRLIEMGNGFAYNDRYFTGDRQLYYFILLTEYLNVTKDYGFLSEKIMPYPADDMKEKTVLELTKACFVFLRDTIGRGVHGLINLMNSDWWDSIYYMESVPYNVVFFTGESHMNTAMAVCTLDKLAEELTKATEFLVDCRTVLDMLSKSISLYREELLHAFMKDMGKRKFPRRMYWNGKAYGENNMFLEPQGFTLQIKELPDERKKELYEEMKSRVYNGEVIGARQQEAPEFSENPEWDMGSRDNGGFWYSLNGPVIQGVATFDKEEAKRLLHNMTFRNMSEHFPGYWCCYWSAADTVESSLVPGSGLADQSMEYWKIPVYCAHPHAWILYCYYKIRNQNT